MTLALTQHGDGRCLLYSTEPLTLTLTLHDPKMKEMAGTRKQALTLTLTLYTLTPLLYTDPNPDPNPDPHPIHPDPDPSL